jgi:mono/diheme cytochrome c family protein
MNTFPPHRAPRGNWPYRVGGSRLLHPARVFGTVSLLLLLAVVAMVILGRSIAGAQTTSPAQKADATPAGKAENGKRIFASQGCNKCHGNEGQGVSQTEREDAGPRIAATRLSFPRFVRFVRDPTGLMQPYSSEKVSDAELADVYAYLQSLAPPPSQALTSAAGGNAQNGQHLYTSYGCYECHGGEGQGSTQTAGSRIGPLTIDFSTFVTYIRQPKGQMPPYTSKAVPDAELADIYAFLQSRPEPPPAKSIPLLNQ